MKTIFKPILLILFIFLSSFSPYASDLTPENFHSEYQLVQENYLKAEAQMTKKLRKRFRDAKHNKRMHLSDSQIQIKKEFDDVKKTK